MKSIYKYLSGLALALFCVTAVCAADNRLVTPDITICKGETFELPFSLNNSDAVVALQFMLTVPDGFEFSTESVVWSERSSGHEMTVMRMSGNTYKFLAYADSNDAFSGGEGVLFTIRLTAAATLAEGSVHRPDLSNLILSKRNGENVANGMSIGSITIAQSPDVVVEEIAADKEVFIPEDEVTISWIIRNIGGLPLISGWSEQIYLVDSNGKEILIGTYQYPLGIGELAAGSFVTREIKVVLSKFLKIEGTVKIKIIVIPNYDSGELSGYKGNNFYITANPATVAKRLYLDTGSKVREGKDDTHKWILHRSGSTERSQTFIFTSTDNRLVIAPVTIPAGASSVSFSPQVIDNDTYDGEVTATLTVQGNGYEPASALIQIIDDDLIRLSLQSDIQRIEPGQTAVFTITTDQTVPEKTAIHLTSSAAGWFTFPAVVYMEAGTGRITATVTAANSEIWEKDVPVTFTVSGTSMASASIEIIRTHTPLPDLSLSLTPAKVSEDAGLSAVTAVLTRSGKTDNTVRIRLSDNTNKGIYYSKSPIVMNAGVTSVTFTLGPVDNLSVDNDRIVTITAAVYNPSTYAAATGEYGGVTTADLTVYDNDGPALSLTTAKWVVLEGDEAGVKITVTRNDPGSEPLAVVVSCDNEDGMIFDRNVVVPAGEASADFTVKAAPNSVLGDDRNVTFLAQAAGHASDALTLLVSDQTLADICVTRLEAEPAEITATIDPLTLSFDIANHGVTALPAGLWVDIYKDNQFAGTVQIEEAVAPGQTVTKSYYFRPIDETGEIRFDVGIKANPTALPEILYTNNSKSIIIRSLPPFRATIQTDKPTYLNGETIHITGHIEGMKTSVQEVEIYAVNRGYRYARSVTTDASGSFSLDYQPLYGQYGHIALGACYPGEGLTSEMAGVDIYGMEVLSIPECKVVQNEPYEGVMRFVNLSSLPLTGFNGEALQLPEGAQLTVRQLTTVAAGTSFDVPFTLDCSVISEGNEWQKIPMRFTTLEGLEVIDTLYFYCMSQRGKLIAYPDIIQTTVPDGGGVYSFTVMNIGKGETGVITLALPPFMKAETNMPMPSIKSEESAKISLRINMPDDMPFNTTMKGNIGINCSNGEGLALPYAVTRVTDVEGTLTVDVCDEYTYYTPGGPHLQNAEVVVVNPITKKEIARGYTDAEGHFTATIQGGLYTLFVSASKHNSKNVNVYVDPGTETVKVVNLSSSTVSVDWKVVETEVEDEYKIETIVVFESQVPAPAVLLELPNSIAAGSLGVGQSLVFNAKLTNKGLIKAENVQLLLEGYSEYWYYDESYNVDEEFVFEPLAYRQPFGMSPGQEVTIPVRVTRTKSAGAIHFSPARGSGEQTRDFPCYSRVGVRYEWYCGSELAHHQYYLGVDMGFKECHVSKDYKPSCSGCGGSSGGSGGGYSSSPFSNPDPQYGFDEYCPDCGLDFPDDIVDVTVRLHFNQKLAFTRQAFRGTLTVTNGNDTASMKDVRLTLRVVNTVTGDEATSEEFQIDLESLTGFAGISELGAEWTLAEKKTGVASILFIPTKYAAPTEETDYSFGGTLTYIDPTTAKPVTRELTPQVLTVSPTPDLELTYFIPREIIADNPLTPDVVEEAQDAEFVVMIANTGYGSARNASLTVNQPQIIDNRQEFPVEFSFSSAKLDGQPVSFTASGGKLTNDFGTIKPNTVRYAQWFMRSTYKGKIKDYDIKMTHLTSPDNPDLSLVSKITAHMLVHGVDMPSSSSSKSGWLVDDLVDDNNTPDMLYRCNGTAVSVSLASSVRMTLAGSAGVAPKNRPAPAQTQTEYILSAEADGQGWVYGNVTDPTEGKMKIQRIVRMSNNEEVSLYNFWQTMSGDKKTFDYRIHFVDSIASAAESYRLYFGERPDMLLDIVSVEGVPETDSPVDTLVTTVFVTFNKPVQAETFNASDLRMTWQGKDLDVSQIGITQLTETRFKIDISSVSTRSGMYSITFGLGGIYDTEGFAGKENAVVSRTWSQYADGKVRINFAVSPANAGSIAYIGDNQLFYGNELQIQATPNAGYVFERWECNGATVSTSPVYSFLALSDMDITARFQSAGCKPLSGSCGANVTWELSCDGVLTIRGNGAMAEYSAEIQAPWYSSREYITKVIIEEGVTTIGYYAFYQCTHVTTVIIASTVIKVGGYAFYECTNLNSVNLPAGLTEIGVYAFYKCVNIVNIIIPVNVTVIGDYAFYDCTGLVSVTIPEGVTVIKKYTFYNCTNIVSVIIPQSVVSIEEYAFYRCSSLTSVVIPSSVTTIKEYAFYQCTGLTSIVIPASVTNIGIYAFYECVNLLTVTVHSHAVVSQTFTEEFNMCTIFGPQVTEYILGENVTAIGAYAFYRYINLVKINFLGQVTLIGNYAFYECTNLTDITLPVSVTEIGMYAFYKCVKIVNIVIPANVQIIGEYAFCYCTGLTSIVIPASVTRIGIYAFYECVNLLTVTVHSHAVVSQTFTEDFNMCAIFGPQVTEFVLGENVTLIGAYAFYRYINLVKVTFLGQLTVIGNYAFYECTNLTDITLPVSVTEIGMYAFYKCVKIVNIVIPANVTRIGMYAFYQCAGIISLTIDNSAAVIGDYAFTRCTALTEVALGNRITSIGISAFEQCSTIVLLDIPKTVTTLGNYAFRSCSGFESVIFHTIIPPAVGNAAFYETTTMFYVPCGSSNAYVVALNVAADRIEENMLPAYTVISEDEQKGTVVMIRESVSCDDLTLSFRADAADGWQFKQWSDGNGDNPRTLILTQDTALTAVFERLETQCSYETTDGITVWEDQLPYTWEGISFTTAGTETKTLQASDGCDSIVTFTLRVLYRNITLQENEAADYYTQFANDYNGRTVTTATLNRQFTQGKWATLCLPFNVNKAMMMSLGLYNRVFAFRYAQQLDDETIQVFFTPAQSIEAGKGYIVNPNVKLAAKTSFVFPNVTINTDSDNGDITALTGYNDGTNRGNLYLVGTLRTGVLVGFPFGNKYLGLKDNQLYYPNTTSGTLMRAYRAVFRCDIPINASRVRIIADGESVTELEVTVDEQGRMDNGQLQNNATPASPARKYIEKGILYIERNGITYTAQGQRLD